MRITALILLFVCIAYSGQRTDTLYVSGGAYINRQTSDSIYSRVVKADEFIGIVVSTVDSARAASIADSSYGSSRLGGLGKAYYDTLGNGSIALKLNISDTSVFARDADLALKLNISDTSVFMRDDQESITAYNATGQGTYIGMFKGLGSLPGDPTGYQPTLKTDYGALYIAANNKYVGIFFNSTASNGMGIMNYAGTAVDVNLATDDGVSYLNGGNVVIGATTGDSLFTVAGSSDITGNSRVGGALSSATINTGHGDFEVGQSTLTTSDVTFDSVYVTALRGLCLYMPQADIDSLVGDVKIGGELNIYKNLTCYRDAILNIRHSTPYGANIHGVSIAGGGSSLQSRGGYLNLYGNEHPEFPGMATLAAGINGYVEIKGLLKGDAANFTAACTTTTINTGHGDFEVGQSTLTTSDVTFDSVDVTALRGLRLYMPQIEVDSLVGDVSSSGYIRSNHSVQAYNATGQGTYIGMFKGLGSLPGDPTGYQPTLKTDYGALYIAANNKYVGIFFNSTASNGMGIMNYAGTAVDVNLATDDGVSYLNGGNVVIGATTGDSLFTVAGSSNITGNSRVGGELNLNGLIIEKLDATTTPLKGNTMWVNGDVAATNMYVQDTLFFDLGHTAIIDDIHNIVAGDWADSDSITGFEHISFGESFKGIPDRTIKSSVDSFTIAANKSMIVGDSLIIPIGYFNDSNRKIVVDAYAYFDASTTVEATMWDGSAYVTGASASCESDHHIVATYSRISDAKMLITLETSAGQDFRIVSFNDTYASRIRVKVGGTTIVYKSSVRIEEAP